MMCLLGTENSEMSQASMSLPLVTFIGIAQRDAGKWWCLDASIPGLSGSNFRDHESVLRSVSVPRVTEHSDFSILLLVSPSIS